MLLDRVLRLCVRNFSTLFLVVFMAIIPLHLTYAFVFHDVFAVQELHPAIAELPERRMVRGVDQAAIARARTWFWVLAAIELAAIPLFVRAVRRVLVQDAEGEVPNALTAWRTLRERSGPNGSTTPGTSVTLTCLLIGLTIGGLTWLTLATALDLMPEVATGAGLALADATSRAAGAAFPLTSLALRSRHTSVQTELKI